MKLTLISIFFSVFPVSLLWKGGFHKVIPSGKTPQMLFFNLNHALPAHRSRRRSIALATERLGAGGKDGASDSFYFIIYTDTYPDIMSGNLHLCQFDLFGVDSPMNLSNKISTSYRDLIPILC